MSDNRSPERKRRVEGRVKEMGKAVMGRMFVLALILLPVALFAQDSDGPRVITLPARDVVPGTFYVHREASEKPRAVRRGEVTLQPGDQLELSGLNGSAVALEDKHIDAVLAIEGLSGLAISTRNLTADAIVKLGTIQGLSRLTLESRNFGDEAIKAFAGQTELSYLHLSTPEVGDAGIAPFGANKHLLSLRLDDMAKVSDKGMAAFAGCSQLNALSLHNCDGISGATFGEFPLERFEAPWCTALTDKAIDLVSKRGLLKHVNLNFCRKITAAGVKFLARCAGLEVVILSTISTFPAASLEWLAACKSLERLEAGVRGDGVDKIIRDVAAHPKLKHLDIRGSQDSAPSDEGVLALKGHASLQFLHLGDCQITDKSLEALATVLTLEDLSFSDASSVTDDGLLKLSKLSRLRYLSLSNCTALTKAGVDKLKESLPRLSIHFTNDYAEMPD